MAATISGGSVVVLVILLWVVLAALVGLAILATPVTDLPEDWPRARPPADPQ